MLYNILSKLEHPLYFEAYDATHKIPLDIAPMIKDFVSDSIDFILAVGGVGTFNTPSDDSITTAKIANSAVTSQKIADGTLDTATLADGAVTEPKIEDDKPQPIVILL